LPGGAGRILHGDSRGYDSGERKSKQAGDYGASLVRCAAMSAGTGAHEVTFGLAEGRVPGWFVT